MNYIFDIFIICFFVLLFNLMVNWLCYIVNKFFKIKKGEKKFYYMKYKWFIGLVKRCINIVYLKIEYSN